MLTGARGARRSRSAVELMVEAGADGAGAGGFEVDDGLGLFGLGDVEVFLLEVGDDLALGVGDDYVEDDEAGGALDGEGAVGVFCGLGAYGCLLGRLGRRLRWGLSGGWRGRCGSLGVLLGGLGDAAGLGGGKADEEQGAEDQQSHGFPVVPV